MDATQIIADVRQHVTRAQTEQALQKLLAFLQTAPEPAAGWANAVRQLKSKYYRTVQDQQKAIISFDNAQLSLNQVTNQLLEILESIEEGRPAPEPVEQESTRQIPWAMIAAIGVLIVVVGAFFMWRNNSSQPAMPDPGEPVAVDENGCPMYPEYSKFNILLLPFKPLDGIRKYVESGLRDRLAVEIEDYEIPAAVQVRNIDVENINNYPSTFREASRFGKPCKAQLVVWGTTEEQTIDGNPSAVITRTNFRFLNVENFSQTELVLNQDAELDPIFGLSSIKAEGMFVDTLSSLSSIASEGVLSAELETNIKILFGLVAHESGEYATAVELFNQAAEEIDVPIGTNWSLILADSYTNMEQYEQAIEVYDAILEGDSTHTDARMKRAYLLYQTGHFQAAATDLTVVVEENPGDANIRTARTAAYIRANQLDYAREDLEVLEESSERPKVTDQLKSEYRERYRIEEDRRDQAREDIKANPNDTTAWRIQAEASRNLGDYDAAGMAAAKLLSVDRNSTFALVTLTELRPMIVDTLALRRVLRPTLQASPALRQQFQARDLNIQQQN